MKKSWFLSLALASLAFGSIACSDSDDNKTPGNENPGNETPSGENIVSLVKSSVLRANSTISNDNLKVFVAGQYDLNLDLLRKSDSQVSGKNAMISTFSIQTALAMTWAGADGDTAAQMKSALNFGDNAHDALNKIDAVINAKNKAAIDTNYEKVDAQEIKTSNNIYISSKYKWANDWLDLLAKNYSAGVNATNFAADPEAARKYINSVVEKDTHNRIKNLIPENALSTDTQLVLTNAIYFKSPWSNEYVEFENTPFNLESGSTVNVTYLKDHDKYAYAKTDDCEAVSVPLRDHDFQVMFILPTDGNLSDLQAKLSGETVYSLIENAKSKTVDLSFPSIEFNTSVSLSDPLKSMGMTIPFTGAADFSKITEDENELFISEIFHKTFVAMNKNGVEAAAATAVIMNDGATPEIEEPIEFNVNRPYMFVIYDSTSKSPLFVGRVFDPTQK